MSRLGASLAGLGFVWSGGATLYLLLVAAGRGMTTVVTLSAASGPLAGGPAPLPPSLATGDGVWMTALLLGVTLVSAVPFGVALRHPRGLRVTAWTVAMPLLAVCVLGGLTVGLYYLPTVLLLGLAGWVGGGQFGAMTTSRRGLMAMAFLLVGLPACSGEDAGSTSTDASDVPAAGTPELRAALADTILARTERREAWSPHKREHFDFDPMEAMRAVRDDVVAADTEEELFYALVRMSTARRDRHLEVGVVPGGLQVPDSAGLDVVGVDDIEPARAPVRIFPDYAMEGAAFFVGDHAAASADLPPIGSRVVAVHGMAVEDWYEAATAFMRHSTTADLRWELADAMTQATAVFPPELRPAGQIELTVRNPDGEEHAYTLPVSPVGELAWQGIGEPSYEGFESLLSTVTYELLADRDRQILVLIWTGFRETMVEDVDRLVDFASQEGMLSWPLLVDVTRSGGGSRGAYAVQRLQSRPFKVTFGNLRISDVTVPFVEERRAAFAAQRLEDGGVPETIDDGSWLMEWFEMDVMPAVERGDAYTNDVPFKSAHAPRDSDGILEPAPLHFTGPFAVLSGPSGGSHLDQFIHQVVDNDLGPVVGMPPGGYSNTWEWEDILTYPGTDRPVVRFMWNIGHTITPDGEIAEGNPAEIDRWIPLTAENVRSYYDLLLEGALEELAEG